MPKHKEQFDESGEPSGMPPLELEIGDILDLHAFSPKEIPGVVATYLEEARRKGFHTVRIIHGKGIGVQRERVHAVLRRTAFVEQFAMAPAEAGSWGATVVWFRKTAGTAAGARSATAMPEQKVEFAGLRLKNPVIAASGTFGYGLEWEPLLNLNELGGLVTKGLSLLPLPGNPPPRLAVTPAGLLNSVGLQNVGVEAFIRDKRARLAALDTVVIANVFGKAVEEYTEVVRRLESAGGLAGYELNLSSPNSKGGGMFFGRDLKLLAEVVSAVRQVCRRPLLAKLTPNVPDIVPFAQAAEAAGADAISLVNTFLGPNPERHAASQPLGGGPGGLSGPTIYGDALRLVERAARAVKIPVIGIGGILCGRDAAAFLNAGAVAVQVGTANFYDPLATLRIARELAAFGQPPQSASPAAS